jgi:hypothetical protein
MLKLNHLTGFGSGAAAAGDVTSYVFDGAGDAIIVPTHASTEFGAGEFTIDCWIKTTATGANNYICGKWAGDGDRSYRLYISTGDKVTFGYSTDGSFSATYVVEENSGGNVNDGNWHHIEAVGNTTDNKVNLYIDGTKQTDEAAMVTIHDNSAFSLYVGGVEAGLWFNGYIDEFRVLKAEAAHLSSFTPPTKQYTSTANTSVLIHGGEAIASGTTGSGATFVDSGNTGHTVSESGNAIRDASIYKF